VTITMTTTEWWLTPHAARQMVARDISRSDVIACAEDPEVSYASGHKYPDAAVRETRQRGDVAIIVNVSTKEIVTVLKRGGGW
jgi:hypothetical protein